MEHCKISNSKHQSTGFSVQVSASMDIFPDTSHPTPETSTKARHLHRQSRLTQTCPVYQVAGTAMEF